MLMVVQLILFTWNFIQKIIKLFLGLTTPLFFGKKENIKWDFHSLGSLFDVWHYLIYINIWLWTVNNMYYLYRVHKITIKCNSLEEVLVTDNWIIKTTPYGIYFAHQSVASLSLDTAETHALALAGTGSAQYLNIKVSFTRREQNYHFYFRYLHYIYLFK